MTEMQAGSRGGRSRSVYRAMILTARAFGLGMPGDVRQEALSWVALWPSRSAANAAS